MVNEISIKRTSNVTSEIVNPILIDETSTTRRILRATVVDNPKDNEASISGYIIHQRKSPNGGSEYCDSINLNTLKAGEGVKMNFSCSQMKSLKEAIEKAYSIGNSETKPTTGKYVFANKNEVILTTGREKEYISKLLSQNYGEDIWNELVETNPDLATKLSIARVQSNRINIVKELEESLYNDFDEGYWQTKLSKNDWIFGYGLSYMLTTIISEQVYLGGKNIKNRKGQVVDFLSKSEGNTN